MDRIKMTAPIVEIDGDEMARVVWKMIREELLLPFVDLNTEYYDLSIMNRERTCDQITIDAGQALIRHKIGVKCSTVTPTVQRMREYPLSRMWKSPNGTIRALLDGTVFRKPILIGCIQPLVRNWKKPITVARHAFGDIYHGTEWRITGVEKAELVLTDRQGQTVRRTIRDFDDPGMVQCIFNEDRSIASFAHACFQYAIASEQDLLFSAKDTISKTYDAGFRDLFQSIYETFYREEFLRLGISYVYRMIDDAVAKTVQSEGGFIWALKNYDGDVMSDLVAGAFGSPALMTSVLCSPNGEYLFESAHGTVKRHYNQYLKTGEIRINPIAMVFSWTGALKKRGTADGNPKLIDFSRMLEESCIETVNNGIMTADLANLIEGKMLSLVSTGEYIRAVYNCLNQKLTR